MAHASFRSPLVRGRNKDAPPRATERRGHCGIAKHADSVLGPATSSRRFEPQPGAERSDVREWDEVAQEAIDKGIEKYIGWPFGICVEKNYELAEKILAAN